MGIFNLFKKKEKNKYLIHLLSLSVVGLDTFQSKCKPTDKKGLFEVLMFNVFFCWTYFNERNLLKPNNRMIETKLLFLHEKASELEISINYEEFLSLYKDRFAHFEKELTLLNKSYFSKNKQYLPAYIFSVFYY